MAPLPTRLHIQNLTRTPLSLVNSSHPFLEPVSLPPPSSPDESSLLAYLPTSPAANLDLVFSNDGATEYRIALSRKGKASSWRKSRWEKVEAQTVRGADPRASSSTSEKTLDGSLRSRMQLRFFRINVSIVSAVVQVL